MNQRLRKPRRRDRGSRWLIALAVTAVLTANTCSADDRAVGSGGDSPADDVQTTDVQKTDVPTTDVPMQSLELQAVDGSGGAPSEVDPGMIEETVTTLGRRLDDIGMQGATVIPEGDVIIIRWRAGADPSEMLELIGRPGRLEFRPVLEVLAPNAGAPSLTPDVDAEPDNEVVLADSYGVAYRLGPTFSSGGRVLDGGALEDATAGINQVGDWVVNPVLREGEDGIELFNDAASACYNAEPICPAQGGARGQLAMVLDGEVLTAPSINEVTFARDQIQVAGAFDRQEAEAVAVALRYGELPLTLAARD